MNWFVLRVVFLKKVVEFVLLLLIDRESPIPNFQRKVRTSRWDVVVHSYDIRIWQSRMTSRTVVPYFILFRRYFCARLPSFARMDGRTTRLEDKFFRQTNEKKITLNSYYGSLVYCIAVVRQNHGSFCTRFRRFLAAEATRSHSSLSASIRSFSMATKRV